MPASVPSSPEALRRTQSLESELEHARRVLSSKLVELKSFETERERLLARIAQRDQKIRDLEAQLARAGAAQAELADARQRIAALESELADALAWAPTPSDDLTRIRGIGPKFAGALRELGVTTFAQMAAWGPEDVSRIADQLKIPANRIVKAGWVESAKALAKAS